MTLKVFDVLGKEVATIVNENLASGTHKRTFDASGFASGVYFYRMQARPISTGDGQAGSFVETKKMILLR